MTHDHKEATMENIKEHFEEVALKYDWYKERAWYYYDWLKKICKKHIPIAHHKRILELGCGTGDVLAYLNPKYGIGIDISENMVAIAKKKHKDRRNLKFQTGAGETLQVEGQFDVILMPDVIEHLADVRQTFSRLADIADAKTKIIVTMINPVWEPILMAGEKMGKKMPEGPHNRISYGSLKRIISEHGLQVTGRAFYVCMPVHVPFFSNPVNWVFNRLPLIRRLGLIEVIEIKKSR
jgi:ubiquinone/menaquinone biosynthesis C-methylase UbiE